MESYKWINFRDITGEIGSKLLAAKDQAIRNNYFKNKILKEEIDSKCRLCKQHEELLTPNLKMYHFSKERLVLHNETG
jgi:hypothetical protein